jgi:hypothetical protein
MRSQRNPDPSGDANEEVALVEILAAVEGELQAAAIKGGAQRLFDDLNQLCALLNSPRKTKVNLRAQVVEAGRVAKKVREQFKRHVDGLTVIDGHRNKRTRSVRCPICKGTGILVERVPILQRERCWRCNGTGKIAHTAVARPAIDLESYRPAGISQLQTHILLVALDASVDCTQIVATKLIRNRLRSRLPRLPKPTNLARSLIGLQNRRLIERIPSSPSAGRRPKATAIRLTVLGRLAAHALKRPDHFIATD